MTCIVSEFQSDISTRNHRNQGGQFVTAMPGDTDANRTRLAVVSVTSLTTSLVAFARRLCRHWSLNTGLMSLPGSCMHSHDWCQPGVPRCGLGQGLDWILDRAGLSETEVKV